MPAASVIPVVTLDGPSGSGKGTVGTRLAARLGWHFLDSGALYRLVGLLAQESYISLDDSQAVATLATTLTPRFIPQSGGLVRVLVGERDIGDALRTETAGEAASRVAIIPEVRKTLLRLQHAMRQPPGLVADGRDMGTVVFADATLKIFITATAEIRAERRYNQLKEKGFGVNLRALLEEIRERDARDAKRTASPLIPAADAVVLDTSSLTIPEVVDRVAALLGERLSR